MRKDVQRTAIDGATLPYSYLAAARRRSATVTTTHIWRSHRSHPAQLFGDTFSRLAKSAATKNADEQSTCRSKLSSSGRKISKKPRFSSGV
jgi:hypothetical protein